MARTADFDPYEPPPGPRPSEIRARWAREGDVEALWNVLVNTPWDRIDREAVFKQLLQALEVRSRSDPRGILAAARPIRADDGLHDHAPDAVSSLLIRVRRAERPGAEVRMPGPQPPGDLPEAAVAKLIPKMLEMQEHLAARRS